MKITHLNDKQTVFWPENPVEEPLIVEEHLDTIVLYQQEDTIYINQSIIDQLIKIFKKYKNPF